MPKKKPLPAKKTVARKPAKQGFNAREAERRDEKAWARRFSDVEWEKTEVPYKKPKKKK